MAYTLGDLVIEIQSRAKDTSFSKSLIIDFINDIQSEVVGDKRWPFMEALETATLNVGDTSHTYAADSQTVYDVTLVDPDRAQNYSQPDYLPHTRFYDLYPSPESATAGWPCHWTDFGHVMQFDRPVDKAYNLRIRYLKAPATLADDADVPIIPEPYKQILVRGALASIEEYRDNFDLGGIHRRKVEDLVANMSARYMPRQFQSAPKSSSRRVIRRAQI